VHLRLITKFTLVTSSVLLVTMVLFAYISVKTQKQMCIQNVIQEADNLSKTLISTTHYQMLENDLQRVYQMMDEVVTQEGIERIRLFNKDGRINFSTDKTEIGTYLADSAEGCNVCHFGDSPPLLHAPTSGRSRIFENTAGELMLGMTHGIYNKESCYTAACHFHPSDAELLGILDVQMALKNRIGQATTFRNGIITLTFILLVLLSLSITLLTQKFVNIPVNMLLAHFQRLTKGDFSSRIHKAPNDELGELALSANEMTENLKKAQDELKEWALTLEERVEERTQKIKEMQSSLIRSEKLASLGELVAGIAHEINNPLTGILMFASMAKDSPELPEDLHGDLEQIVNETQRCAQIVRGLLDFGRETSPQKRLDSVNRIMDRTLSLIQHQASFQNISIVRNYQETIPDIEVDPNQLEQVYMNVVINASQAMPHGGTMTITTGVDSAQSQVVIRVSDTGCGIPEENLERIFDPFFTTKEQKGTGLGLSVSYGIIENHGGTIEVESQLGVGTSFIIRLPLKKESMSEDTAA